MILHKDNPSLPLKTVKTIKGETEYRRNCKYIKGNYYLINRDCFEIDGTWYRVDSGLILFDAERQVWLTKKSYEGQRLIRGVVEFSGSKPILGHFSPNVFNNIQLYTPDGNRYTCLNPVIALEAGYIEDVGTGRWHNAKELGASGLRRAKTIRNERSYTDRGYNIEDNKADFDQKVANFERFELPISKNVETYAKFLGDVSFGAEIEISQGTISDWIQHRTGTVLCRDGSIGGGPEIVTIPMKGAKGVQNLVELSKYLKDRGDIDTNCSFHVHIGNLPSTTKMYLASVYSLCRQIQDEVFQMFPYYKTDPTGVKRKNYNQKLTRLGTHALQDESKEGYTSYVDDFYERIFRMLTEGAEDRIPGYQYNRKTRQHPIRQKWNRLGR